MLSSSSSDGTNSSEWIKAKDSKGRTFYANRLTRQTQWEIPAVLQQKKEEEDNESKSNSISLQLPPFWEERIDPSSKRPFYVNHVDKITTWEHPGLKISNNRIEKTKTTIAAEAAPTTYYTKRCDVEVEDGGNDYFYQHRPRKGFELYYVPDEERSCCQGCNLPFNVGRRKHHCRSCGDIFCIACSSHKCVVPTTVISSSTDNNNQQLLQQRVCYLCYKDIQKQQGTNKPIMRRYLTTIQLLHRTQPDNVIAALASFTNELHTMILNHEEMHGISPADIIVPTIGHLFSRAVVDDITAHAVHSLATLLALGSIVGDPSFACACFYPTTSSATYSNKLSASTTLNSLIFLMENIDQKVSSKDSNNMNLAIKEQSARALFYATENNVIEALLICKNDGNAYEDTTTKSLCLDSFNVPKAMQILLDHAIIGTSPRSAAALQRWCAGTIRHLVTEDCRRACASNSKDYESFILSSHFIPSGSVMILCSLMSADDADTRAHATSTLTFIIDSLRTMDGTATESSSSVLASIIQQLCENVCGDALDQLLMSADNSIASLGLALIFSMVSPLLTEPLVHPLPKDSCLMSNMIAALKIASDSCCLSILVQIVNSDNRRPIEVRAIAMKCLAAVCLACSISYNNSDRENNMPSSASASAIAASKKIQSQGVAEVCVSVLSKCSQGIFLISGAHHESSPSSQLLEAGAISLAAILDFHDAFSNSMIVDWTKKVLFDLLSIAKEQGMQGPSKLRGTWAVRCLPFIDCASKLIHRILIDSFYSRLTTDSLDCLLEALDAGAVSVAIDCISKSSISFTRRETGAKAANELCGQLMLQINSCRILNDLICLSIEDETLIGRKRLNQVMRSSFSSFSIVGEWQDKDNKGCVTLVSTIINMMNEATILFYQQESPRTVNLALLQELIQQCTSVLASIVGAPLVIDGTTSSSTIKNTKEASVSSIALRNGDNDSIINLQGADCCATIVSNLLISGNDAVAAMLVGGLGGGCMNQLLRLICAIVSNGHEHLCQKVSCSRILLPVLGLLQNSHDDEFRFNSCIAIIRNCCPFITSESAIISALRSSVETISKELISLQHSNSNGNVFNYRHNRSYECISALEAMSRNPSMWTALGSSIPMIVNFIDASKKEITTEDINFRSPICTAIRTIQNVIQQPSLALNSAYSGLPKCLCHLIRDGFNANNNLKNEEDAKVKEQDVQVLALNVLATISFHSCSIKSNDNIFVQLLQCGFIDAACLMLSERGVKESDDFAESIVITGLSLIYSFLNADVNSTTSTGKVIQSIGQHHSFIKTLLATLLTKEKTIDQNLSQRAYGPPLILLKSSHDGFQSLHQASATLLISLASFSAGSACDKEDFWRLFSPSNIGPVEDDELLASSTAVCGALLSWSIEHNIAKCGSSLQRFVRPALPTVRQKLLQCICRNISMNEMPQQKISDNFSLSIVEKQNIPQICLEMCRIDQSLVLPACELFKIIKDQSPDTLSNVLSNKHQILLFFDMLRSTVFGGHSFSKDGAQILCDILLMLPRPYIGTLVEKHEMKAVAIDNLTSAFNRLITEESKPLLSSSLTDIKEAILWCLLSIAFPHVPLDQVREGNEQLVAFQIKLDVVEAQSLATSIGGSLSLMIMDQFIHVASSNTTADGKKQESIENPGLLVRSPEALLLCALCSMKEPLHIIYEQGGFEAIVVLAHEQDINAVRAMQEAAKHYPLMVIESDGHNCIIEVMCHQLPDETGSHQMLLSCLDFLTNICTSSRQGRLAIIQSEMIVQCIDISCAIMLQISCNENFGSPNSYVGDQQNSKIFALSCLFLTELSRSDVLRKTISRKEKLLQVCSKIATEGNYEIACEAAKLLATLSPTVVDSPSINFGPNNLADTFVLALQRNLPRLGDDIGDAGQLSSSLDGYYKLLSEASSGLECVFNHMTTASREAFMANVAHRFQTLVVLSDDVIRSREPPMSSDAAGILAYNLTNLFLKMSTENSWRIQLAESRIVQDLCLMIILYDLALDEYQGQPLPLSCNTLHWKAARTHCLQCICSLLCTDSTKQLFTAGLERALSSSSCAGSVVTNGGNGQYTNHCDPWLNCVALHHFLCAIERIAEQTSDDPIAAATAKSLISKLI